MLRLASFRFPLVVAFAAGSLIWAGCDDDDFLTGVEEDADFEAAMTGAAERPDPVTTNARGAAFFDFTDGTVRFAIEVEDIQNVIGAHIHVGGVDVAGPIIVPLFDAGGNPVSFTGRAVLVESTFTEADIDPQEGIDTLEELEAAMVAGNTYVNVHTTENPLGEIRGQLEES